MTCMYRPTVSYSKRSQCECTGSCTRGADVGWNGHIRAETQEVAFIGLLILSTVWHQTHTAYREQRLMGNRTEIGIINTVGWL